MGFSGNFSSNESGAGQSSSVGSDLLGSPVAVPSKDLHKKDLALSEARKKNLRAMNALKIISPILLAVIERQGGEEASVSLFKDLVGKASTQSENLLQMMGEDPSDPANFWMRNVLERTFCELLREQVGKGKDPSLKSLDPVLKFVAESEWAGADASKYETWGTATSIKVALFKGVSHVLAKISVFDFFRKDIQSDLDSIANLLMGAASRGTLSMSDPHASEVERASLFGVLLNEAGLIYANSWQVCGKQVLADLNRLSDSELKALIAANPKGLSLNRVESLFELNFERLLSLSSRLVPQKSGKVDQRLSKA